MLILTDLVYEELCAHARAEYPRECCGIILGELDGSCDGRKIALGIIPAENKAGSELNTAHFRIDPIAVLKAEQEPFEILGFYHSHPDCEAIPSKEDILCMISSYSYLIVSVRNGKCGDMRSFERIFQTSENIIEELLIKEQ